MRANIFIGAADKPDPFLIFDKKIIPTRKQAETSGKSRNCRDLHLNIHHLKHDARTVRPMKFKNAAGSGHFWH